MGFAGQSRKNSKDYTEFLGIHGKKCLGSGSVEIPCNWSFLAEKATENPVSVAQHYKKLIHDLMSILVGIIPASTSDGESSDICFHSPCVSG